MSINTTRQRDSQTQHAIGLHTISFEAQGLEELSRQVTGWLMEHPSSTPLAFSHAAETQSVVRTPVSLSGSEPRVVYTGILLVQA